MGHKTIHKYICDDCGKEVIGEIPKGWLWITSANAHNGFWKIKVFENLPKVYKEEREVLVLKEVCSFGRDGNGCDDLFFCSRSCAKGFVLKIFDRTDHG